MEKYRVGSILDQEGYRGSLFYAINGMISAYNKTSDPKERDNIAKDGEEVLALAKQAGMVPQSASFERYYEKLTGKEFGRDDVLAPDNDPRRLELEAQRVALPQEAIDRAVNPDVRKQLETAGLVSNPAEIRERLVDALAAENIELLAKRKDGDPPVLSLYVALGVIEKDQVPQILALQRQLNEQVQNGEIPPPDGSDRFAVRHILPQVVDSPEKIQATEAFYNAARVAMAELQRDR